MGLCHAGYPALAYQSLLLVEIEKVLWFPIAGISERWANNASLSEQATPHSKPFLALCPEGGVQNRKLMQLLL